LAHVGVIRRTIPVRGSLGRTPCARPTPRKHGPEPWWHAFC